VKLNPGIVVEGTPLPDTEPAVGTVLAMPARRPDGSDTFQWYRLGQDPGEKTDLSNTGEAAATSLGVTMSRLSYENLSQRIEGRRVTLEELDEETIEQLRGLGYLD